MKTQLTLMTALVFGLAIGHAQADGRSFGDGTLPDFLEVFDTDGDGVLSEEERQAMREARHQMHQGWLEHWDTDGDGVLSEEERQAAIEAMRARIEERRTDRFHEADTDGDGCLSYEEFTAIPAVARLLEEHPEKVPLIFDRLDADDDDCVSLEEFIAHLRIRHRRHPGDRPPPGDGPGGE